MIIGVAAVPDGGVCRAWYAPARAPTATYPSCVLNRTVNTQCQSCVGVDHSVKHSDLSESIVVVEPRAFHSSAKLVRIHN
jgi:hypothetical protein